MLVGKSIGGVRHGLLFGAAALALAAQSNADPISPLSSDGNFGLQTPTGSVIKAPWTPNSGVGNSGNTAAQSPYTNVFSNNGIGARTEQNSVPEVGNQNYYFVQTFGSIDA